MGGGATRAGGGATAAAWRGVCVCGGGASSGRGGGLPNHPTTQPTNQLTGQVNLDFGSEADMIEKFRVGLALQPMANALFASSPFKEGKPSG